VPNHTLPVFTERAHLRNPDITVLVKLSVDGEFDEQRFGAALQVLKSVHPLLYSTVQVADDGQASYIENAVNQLAVFSMKREYDDQWLDVAQVENKRPFKTATEPLVRFFVFYGVKDFDILAVAHHLLGDGNAIARLLRDVVKAYADIEMLHQKQRLLSSLDDFPTAAKSTFIVKAFTHNLNRIWRKGEMPRFGEQEYLEMFNSYHLLSDIKLLYSTINANQMDSLQQACKAHGVTINDAIITAFITAMREHCLYRQNKEMTIAVPINIRNQLLFATDDSLGNFASAITIKQKGRFSGGFWANTSKVQSKIKAKIESVKASWVNLNLYALLDPTLIDAIYFTAFSKCSDKAARRAAAILGVSSCPSTTAVSNLGRLSFDNQIGNYHIHDMVIFAPKAPVSYLTLGIVTLDKTMHIGYSYDQNLVSLGCMKSISLRLVELLSSCS